MKVVFMFSFQHMAFLARHLFLSKCFIHQVICNLKNSNSTFSIVTSVFTTGIDGMYLFYLVTYFDVPRNTRQGRQHSLKQKVPDVWHLKLRCTELVAINNYTRPAILGTLSFSTHHPHHQHKGNQGVHRSASGTRQNS
jgi:hypothetical protein